MAAVERPSTSAEYKRQAKRYILPKLGSDKVAAVTRDQIKALHGSIATAHCYMANRVLAPLSVMCNLAIEKKYRTDNPCARIKKEPEEARQTYLDPEQIGRPVEPLVSAPEKTSAAAIRLMLLTGCPRNEALASTWAEFDLQAAVRPKLSTKTKAKRPHRIPLSAAAVDVLAEMQAEAAKLRKESVVTPYVFPSGKQQTEALKEVRRTWASARKTPGLSGVRLHDLRHSFASASVSGGLSLPVIGQLLGHSRPRTTRRYSHLYDSALREAAERVGNIATNGGKPKADIVEHSAGRRAR